MALGVAVLAHILLPLALILRLTGERFEYLNLFDEAAARLDRFRVELVESLFLHQTQTVFECQFDKGWELNEKLRIVDDAVQLEVVLGTEEGGCLVSQRNVILYTSWPKVSLPAARCRFMISALLQQAQKLSHDTQVSDDLPRVERTLTQVLQATQELHSRTFEPLDPISTTDIQSFLRNEKENAILSVIEEVHKNSLQAAQNAKWEHTMNDWKLEKVKLMNALVGPSQNWMDIRKGPEQTTLNESTFGGRSSLNIQKMAYAREVYEYNKLINEGAMRPSLVQRFAQVADGFKDSKVSGIWEIMKYMPSVKPSPRTQDPLRARCTQTQFIEQAKRYLENRYKLFMQTVIAEHLRDAQRGGISSILNLVGSFVGLKFANQNQNLCL
ncbi:hypothetical protein pipiens_016050 [Culex pipiens pipiens]|uniref:Nuclear pore protein n=1 Tax=Culex pipiens pipiens TaxID=38569 RepID=A0ABD1CN10_CULPP